MRFRDGDEWKTAFWTRYNYFESQVIRFDLSNALVSLQSYMNKILAEKLDIFVIVYLNKILIHTDDLDQGHIDTIPLVLE